MSAASLAGAVRTATASTALSTAASRHDDVVGFLVGEYVEKLLKSSLPGI